MLGSFAFRVVNVDPKFLQRDDALLGKPSIRIARVSAERAGESPEIFAALVDDEEPSAIQSARFIYTATAMRVLIIGEHRWM